MKKVISFFIVSTFIVAISFGIYRLLFTIAPATREHLYVTMRAQGCQPSK